MGLLNAGGEGINLYLSSFMEYLENKKLGQSESIQCNDLLCASSCISNFKSKTIAFFPDPLGSSSYGPFSAVKKNSTTRNKKKQVLTEEYQSFRFVNLNRISEIVS